MDKPSSFFRLHTGAAGLGTGESYAQAGDVFDIGPGARLEDLKMGETLLAVPVLDSTTQLQRFVLVIRRQMRVETGEGIKAQGYFYEFPKDLPGQLLWLHSPLMPRELHVEETLRPGDAQPAWLLPDSPYDPSTLLARAALTHEAGHAAAILSGGPLPFAGSAACMTEMADAYRTITREEFDALSQRLTINEALLLNITRMLYGRSIEKTPGVCGGSARLLRTRIPVWTLELLRRQGATDAALLESYPTLKAADLVAAWAYAQEHAEEIERDIQENEAD